MTTIIHGERVGKQGSIRLGCSAVVFNETRSRVLLTRRLDNGQWCLPSGGVEPGESVAEACKRETYEETGLEVEIVRLTGVYSDPDFLVKYQDGNQAQIVALNFEARITSGTPGLSNETSAFGWYSIKEIEGLEVLLNHRQRILDTLAANPEAFIR
jgi:ADP-ribose pyrophosphatase YjhB (NUDIX family)